MQFLYSIVEFFVTGGPFMYPILAVFAFGAAIALQRVPHRQNVVANLQRVGCPVLLLQGELDFQVSVERDAPLLEAALRDVEHPDYQLVTFDGLDHLFKRASGETSTMADYFTDRPVDPEFLQTLERWLAERLLTDG